MTTSNSEVRVRIAPSPTGDWHLGNARTALFTYLYARHHGGKFYLRIEDTDRTRLVEGAVDRLLGILDWLGMTPDALPDGKPYFVQSENLARYKAVVDQLLEAGRAYYCFATAEELEAMRKDQEAAKQPPRYDNRWGYRDLPLAEAKERVSRGDKAVVRLKMPTTGEIVVQDVIRGAVTFQANTLDDHVILKSDGFPTYHLAHVVDDRDMGITLVSRGEEWISSAPRHVVLHEALGWPVPQYAHVPIILGPDKGKLSKRHGAKPVYEYQKDGYLADALVNYLALLGWSSGDDQVIFSRDELIQKFSLERVQPSPAVFDATKLDWFNGQYIRSLIKDTGDLNVDVAALRAELFKVVPEVWQQRYHEDAAKVNLLVAFLAERMVTLHDFAPTADAYYVNPTTQPNYLSLLTKQSGEDHVRLREILEQVVAKITTSDWTVENVHNAIKQVEAPLLEVIEAGNYKKGEVLWPIRVALTGLPASPGAYESLLVLGKEESLNRLNAAISQLA